MEQFCAQADLAAERAGQRVAAGVGDDDSRVVAVIAAAEVHIILWLRVPCAADERGENNVDFGVGDKSLRGAGGGNCGALRYIGYTIEKLVQPRSDLGAEPVIRS